MANEEKSANPAVPTTDATPVAVMTAQSEQAIALAKTSFEQIATRSREVIAQSLKAVDAVTTMSRGNVDALLESSRAASGGLQAIVLEVAEYSKQSVERTASTARAMSHAKTAPELMQIQNEFAHAEFTTAIAEISKLSQSMFQTMTAIFEPVQKQALLAAQIKDLMNDKS